MANQRGSIIPVIAFLFGAAVVVTIFGYMLWPKDEEIYSNSTIDANKVVNANAANNNANATNGNANANTNTNTNTNAAVDATAGWKTYENEKFGFTIKHPKDWSVTTGTSNNATAIYVQSADNKEFIYVLPQGEFDRGTPTNNRTESATLGQKNPTRFIFWNTDQNNPALCWYQFPKAPATNWVAPDAAGKGGNRVEAPCLESETVKTILSTFTFTKN